MKTSINNGKKNTLKTTILAYLISLFSARVGTIFPLPIVFFPIFVFRPLPFLSSIYFLLPTPFLLSLTPLLCCYTVEAYIGGSGKVLSIAFSEKHFHIF